MKMKSLARTCAALLTLVVCVGLTAEARANLPAQHDRGFYTRLSFGTGWGQSRADRHSIDFIREGLVLDTQVAMGGFVDRNFAIHGTAFALVTPSLRTDSEPAGFAGQARDFDALALGGIGPGFTWFFGDTNIYLSASGGFAALFLIDDFDERDDDFNGVTRAGLAADAMLGKQWFVTDYASMGLAAAFNYHFIPESDDGFEYNGYSASLRFTLSVD